MNMEVRNNSPENPSVPVSSESFLAFFGVQSGNLPSVTIDRALKVPAVAAAVGFLSNTLANIPLHAYRSRDGVTSRLNGDIEAILNQAPNDEWTSFAWRKYFWHQVFTGGRGLSWIERDGKKILNIWPLEPGKTAVRLVAGRKIYNSYGQTYDAADVIDVPFMLRSDQVSVYSPITLASKAIQLALAMNDYAAGFFAGGGVPPLALVGPMPAGAEAVKRAQGDIKRAIDAAKSANDPVFPIPLGYELKPVGFDPAKGQMTEARQFQVVEIARGYNLPPVFLQDLTHGTFSNTEQQDLHLTKHLISSWAKAFEDEINLKVFGRKSGGRFAEHNLDGLMRGDLTSRMNALAKGVQNALLTPDEGREMDNRPARPHGNLLYIQGATVPLGSTPTTPTKTEADPVDDEPSDDNGGASDPES